jgi:drug/metabolite transporter (DMT)-like permease
MIWDFGLDRTSLQVFVELGLVVVLSTLGQLSFKAGVTSMEVPTRLSELPLDIVTNPALVLTGAVYAIALVLYAHVLSSVELSAAYPLIATTYILVPLGSVYLLGESMSDLSKLGIVLIASGVALVGLGLEG